MAGKPFPLTVISGGINRLRTKGGADRNVLYELLNGYVTQANTVKVRPGTTRDADIAAYSGAGMTKGLVAYQGQKHVFSHEVVDVPPGYALHVLGHPAALQAGYTGQLSSVTTVITASAAETDFPFGGTWASAGFGYSNGTYSNIAASVGQASVTNIGGNTLVVAGVVTGTGYNGSPASPALIVALAGNLAQTILDSVTMTPYGGLPAEFLGSTAVFNPGGNVPATSGYTVWAWPLSSAGEALVASAQSTATFSIYEGTGDPYWNSVSMLMPFDGPNGSTNFVDESHGRAFTATAGAAISTTEAEFGGSSLYLPGCVNGGPFPGVATPVDASLDLYNGSNSFTVELWVYVPAGLPSGANAYVLSLTTASAYIAALRITNTGQFSWLQSTGYALSSGSFTPVTPGAWHHVAIVMDRTAGWQYVAVDGTLIVNQPASDAPNVAATTLTIGCSPIVAALESPNTQMPVYIDEVRITKGVARYPRGNFTPPTAPFADFEQPGLPTYIGIPIKEIHFSAPFLGGLYVVAEFDTTSAIAAQYGSVFHYWIQSSTTSDNSNAWAPNTDYTIGDVVIPTVPNGLTYIASRRYPANPVWTANTLEALNNVVEPTVPNGFKYTCTAVAGTNPSTGANEPAWPTTDNATVQEFSAVANDQTIVNAATAPAQPTPTVPIRYKGWAG
ncbi:MAG: LamG domain-containing protein [Patescibacteria group bacterium]|nr:LamG domain-containing protein [Patescibacteria group bacterium]